MATGLAIVIMIELISILFLCWGFANEEKFIEAEDRIIAKIKSRAKGGKNHVGR